jgi:hypothetical protein
MAEPAAVPGGLRAVGADETAPRLTHRAGLIYVIALSAIALPAVVLLCVSSIPAGRIDFADLRTGAGRGEFLIPVIILCAEAVHCWTLEVRVKSEFSRWFRQVACLTCILTGIVCFAATVIAAATANTAATSRSLVGITIYSIVIGAALGLAALILLGIQDSR